MSRGKLSREEQETIIIWNNAGDTCYVTTYDRALMRRVNEGCLKNSDINKVDENEEGMTFTCPKSFFKFRLPREISDEQRAAMAERARAMREKLDGEE